MVSLLFFFSDKVGKLGSRILFGQHLLKQHKNEMFSLQSGQQILRILYTFQKNKRFLQEQLSLSSYYRIEYKQWNFTKIYCVVQFWFYGLRVTE